MLTVTDVSTTCAVVIFKVKVSCITSVDGIILWLLIWLVNYVVMLLVVCQLSRDVIGCEYNTINWHDTTHFDSEDDYRTGCRNVSHRQQQQSYSGLRSPGRSNLTYFWNDSWVQTFHIFHNVTTHLPTLLTEQKIIVLFFFWNYELANFSAELHC